MVQVCDYSSLIFAGNTTVLLILSLTTDYWEYRAFDLEKIIAHVNHSRHTELVLPIDTNSYLQIRFKFNGYGIPPNATSRDHMIYYPTMFIKQRYLYVQEFNSSPPEPTAGQLYDPTVVSHSKYDTIRVEYFQQPVKNSKSQDPRFYNNGAIQHYRVEAMDNTDETEFDHTAPPAPTDRYNATWEVHSEVNLFQQYGNLFRDCDALEVGVRARLGLNHKRRTKCVYFDTARETSSVYLFAPELTHLENSASACALLCMIFIVIGSFSGSYGLFSNYTCLKAYVLASCMSLAAGFFLTLSIALFHGKCYILRKMELLPGHVLPFRQLLNESRTYSYGWSFGLAWICVLFCYTSSYVWLCKSQGSSRGRIIQRFSRRRRIGKRTYRQYIDEDNYSVKDIATV